jgi:hypothetical protein
MALSGSDGLPKETKLAKCVWEIHKHESGDPRGRYTLGDWLEELVRVLELPDDGIRVNGPIEDPPAERGLGDVLRGDLPVP